MTTHLYCAVNAWGGYFSSDRLNKTCRECTKGTTLFTLIVSGVFAILASAFIIRKLVISHNISRITSITGIVSMKEGSHSDTKGLLRVLIGHIQVLIILSNLQLRGPHQFHTAIVMAAGSIMPSLSPAALKCVLNIKFDASVLVAVLTPLILLGLLLIFVLVVALILRSTIKTMVGSTFTVLLFVFYLVHPAIMKQLLEVFHIHEHAIEGEWYLQSDMFVTQSSPEYSRMFLIALFGGCLWVGYTFVWSIVVDEESTKRRRHRK